MLDFYLNIGIGILLTVVCLSFWKIYLKKKTKSNKENKEFIINKEPIISQEIINIAESSNTWEIKLYKKFTIFTNPHNKFQYMFYISGNRNWYLNASFSTLLTEDEKLYLEDKISSNLKNVITSPKLDFPEHEKE
jgi:hypothetical protein